MALATGVGLVLAAFGWGRILQREGHLAEWPWLLTTAVGFAVLCAWGGLLNALGLAHGWALLGLLMPGWWAVLAAWWADPVGLRKSLSVVLRDRKLELGLIGLMALGYLWLLGPPEAVNLGDDLRKYFTHPAHMLQTGTVHQGMFGSVTWQNMGAHGFLQGYFAAVLPLVWIDALDAGLGLLLCMGLVANACHKLEAPRLAGLSGMLLVLAINPQYVNVSTLYFGCYLLMAVALLPFLSAIRRSHQEWRALLAGGLGLGMLVGTVLAMKFSFAPILLALCIVIAMAMVSVLGFRLRRYASWAAFVVWGTLASVAPWLWMQKPALEASWSQGAPPIAPDDPYAHIEVEGLTVEEIGARFWGGEPMFYGYGVGRYTDFVYPAIACVLGALAWVSLAFSRRKHRPSGFPGATVIAVGTCILVPGSILLGLALSVAHVNAFSAQMRYALQPCISFVPMALLFISTMVREICPKGDRYAWASRLPGWVGLLLLLPLGPTFIARLEAVRTQGSQLAYPHDVKNFQDTTAYLLSEEVAQEWSEFQRLFPSHETVAVHINQPYLWDAARQPTEFISSTGIAKQGHPLPLSGDVERFETFLRTELDASWVVWQGWGASSASDQVMLQNAVMSHVRRDASLSTVRLRRMLRALTATHSATAGVRRVGGHETWIVRLEDAEPAPRRTPQ